METQSRWLVDIRCVQEQVYWFPWTNQVCTRKVNSSSSVHKPAYCWQRTGQTKLLKSSASLTGSFFSSWSSARQFYLPLGVRTPSGITWNLKRSVSIISYNMLLPRSQPLGYLCLLVTGTVTFILLPVYSAMPTVDMVSEPVTPKVRKFWNSPMVSESATPGSIDCFTLLLARHLADVSCYIGPSMPSGICMEIHTEIVQKRKKKQSRDEGIPRQPHVYL